GGTTAYALPPRAGAKSAAPASQEGPGCPLLPAAGTTVQRPSSFRAIPPRSSGRATTEAALSSGNGSVAEPLATSTQNPVSAVPEPVNARMAPDASSAAPRAVKAPATVALPISFNAPSIRVTVRPLLSADSATTPLTNPGPMAPAGISGVKSPPAFQRM